MQSLAHLIIKTKGIAMRPYPYRYGLLLLLFLLYSGTVFSKAGILYPEAQQIKIFLPQSSVINSDEYRLGEIAQLEGEDFILLDRLAKVVIGRAPLPGRKLTVTRSLILSRLRSHKVNIKKFVFPGSDSTSIQRAALKISGNDIEQVVLNHIKETKKFF